MWWQPWAPSPSCPRIPGIDAPNVISAVDAYGHLDQLGHRVVVVGGGKSAWRPVCT